MNLDTLSDRGYALLLLAVLVGAGAASFPLVDALKRHLAYWRIFKAQERRLR